LRSVFAREGVQEQAAAPLLSWLTWVYPNRPLTEEFDRIIAAGYVKGADLWHLANALFLDPERSGLTFLTLDRRQRQVAARLGFTR